MTRLGKVASVGRIDAAMWDNLVDAVQDTVIGHSHDGQDSRFVGLKFRTSSQHLFGSHPVSIEGTDARVIKPYGGPLYLDRENFTDGRFYFEVVLSTTAGQARARLLDWSGKILACVSTTSHSPDLCRVEFSHPSGGLGCAVVADIGNTTSILRAGVVVEQ